jgi:hypothetical protein
MFGVVMRVRSVLACCLVFLPVAADADSPRFLPLSFDAHERRSLAIVGLKPQREPRPGSTFPFHPETRDAKPRFELSGKGLKVKLRF